MKKFLFIIAGTIIPIVSFAQFETSSTTGWVGCNGPDCNWNSFISLIARVMKNGYIFAFFVLIIMIAYAGFLLLTSGGSSDKKTKAKSVVTGVVIGMIVMFFSYAIVIYILRTLGVDTGFFQLLEF